MPMPTLPPSSSGQPSNLPACRRAGFVAARRHSSIERMTRSLSGSIWLMLTPAVALIAVFILVPMVLTVWLSFHEWSTQTGFGSARFVGLRNFADLLGPISVGRDFKRAFLNTAIYTVLSVVVILPLSVLLGLLVHQTRVAGGNALRTVLFSTYMVPMIAVALVWSKLY